MTTWILIADTARAKLLTTELPEQAWTVVEAFENAGAHLTSKDLSPTPPGKMKQSGDAKSRHTSFEPRTTPKAAELDRYVQRLTNFLEEATARRGYDRLVLVAPPHLLGMLRNQLGKQSAARMQAAIDKDLVALDNDEIRERLSAEVFAASS
jgi:protein required for attachment to host cells